MKREEIERVFGRGRLKMATGEHVEVFREAVASNERRRYTKRFLATNDADFRQWTQREWRILARLIGHGIRCVPDVVQFDGGGEGGMRQVQTYDAGVTVDQWATLLPVSRNGARRAHVFEDCAHWWALAHHCLVALEEIHALQLVHLDIKADNICIPYGPATFDPDAPDTQLHVLFDRLALIDFAFSLVSREKLATALPIGWQKDYDYQSPRLLKALEAGRAGDLRPTQELDWRCDLYSLAAMLRRYLPDDEWARAHGAQAGWSARRYDDARALIYRLRECHDRDATQFRPHQELIDATAAQVAAPDLERSLATGWSLRRDLDVAGMKSLVTPMTRIALARVTPTAITMVPRPIVVPPPTPAVIRRRPARLPALMLDASERAALPPAKSHPRVARRAIAAATIVVALAAMTAPAFVGDRLDAIADAARDAWAALRTPSMPTTTPASQPPAAPAQEPAVANAQRDVKPDVKPNVNPDARVAKAPDAAAPRIDPPMEPAQQGVVPQRAVDTPRPAPALPAVEKAARPSALVAHAAREMPAPALPRQHASIPPSPPVRVPHAAPPLQMAKAAPPAPAPVSAAPVRAPSAAEPTVIASVQPNPVESPVDLVAPPPTDASSAAVGPAPGTESSAPAMQAEAAPQKTPASNQKPLRTQRRDAWRAALHDVLQLLGAVEQRPAPVDERSARVPRPSTPLPRGGDLPVAPPVAMAAPQPPVAEAAAPRPPDVVLARASVVDAVEDDLGAQGRRMLADAVPRIAVQARADAARVLWSAAVADDRAHDRTVIDATYVPWRSERAYLAAPGSTARARELYDDARRAFTSGRDHDAIDLGTRALAANPRDPDIAGFLAYLHLRTRPAQAETARQLALYALAFSGASRSERLDDWHTLAVASALSGRQVDASQALLVELALSRDAERSCREALRAYDAFGERLRMPVDTLLRRVHAQQRGYESPACAWPAYRTASR